jgi:hypothetical protein
MSTSEDVRVMVLRMGPQLGQYSCGIGYGVLPNASGPPRQADGLEVEKDATPRRCSLAWLALI